MSQNSQKFKLTLEFCELPLNVANSWNTVSADLYVSNYKYFFLGSGINPSRWNKELFRLSILTLGEHLCPSCL